MTVYDPECDCCGFSAPDLKVTPTEMRGGMRPPAEVVNLCEVCRSTLIGNSFLYPGQYEHAALYRSLAYCTNRILQAIKEKS